MHIVFEEKLKAYMQKKGYVAVSFEAFSPLGSTADTTEVLSNFVRAKDFEGVKAKAQKCFETEDGAVLIMNRGLDIDEEIILGLKSFLGIKDIAVEGVSAFKL